MLESTKRTLVTAAALIICFTASASAYCQSTNEHDWPQWRGPNRDNVSRETGLLKEWPEGGPHLVWQADGLGRGIASVSIAKHRIYTTGYHFPGGEPRPASPFSGSATAIPQGEYLLCLEAESGQLAWATRVGEAVFENHLMRWLSQRTPTVDDDRLYVATASGEVVCLATDDGRELWRKNCATDFQAQPGRWGFCDYPLVDGDQLICTPGGETATVVALNKHSGEVLWKCPIEGAGEHGYAAAVVCELLGVRQYVIVCPRGGYYGIGTDGNLLWRHSDTPSGFGSVTPNLTGDEIIVPQSYRGSGILRLTFLQRAGALQVEDVEIQPQGISLLNDFQDNSLLIGDRMYVAGRSRGLACLNSQSFEILWQTVDQQDGLSRSRGMVGMTYADGRLYVRYSDGRMTLVEPQEDRSRQVGAFAIPDAESSIGVTMPVVSNGNLFLRDDDRMFCYDVREGNLSTTSTRNVTINLSQLVDNELIDAADAELRSVFVPTPHDVVAKMLRLAGVTKDDVVCDLGSGDGRIVIAAAKNYGCKAIGIELDKKLIDVAQAQARESDVESLTSFEQQDIFKVDLAGYSVITLYLLPEQNEQLIPLLEKLPPGCKIVAHQNPIPGVRPDRVTRVESNEDENEHTLYLWTTPLIKTKSFDGSDRND